MDREQKLVLSVLPFLLLSVLHAQPVYNVKRYGAAGDGAANDTPAVQSAINAARAAGSGTVYFPASSGCYLVSGLMFYSNITYTGENQDVCIKMTSPNESLVNTPVPGPFSNATISYLTFNGNASGFNGNDCLSLRGPTNVRIDHVTTTRCGQDGVYVTGWGYGTHPTGQGNGVLITNLTSSYNGRNGMSIIVGKNITVRDSLFEYHAISPPFAGVDVEPNVAEQAVENITFENCAFQDNTYYGFNAWEFNADRPNLNLRLINCAFHRNGRDGAYIAGSGHIISGIYVSGNMSGNRFEEGYRGGLDIMNANNIVVTNLTVTGAREALFIRNAKGVMVANSHLSGSLHDVNTDISTNVQVYTSTILDHQTSSGTFSRPSGTAPTITTTSLRPATRGVGYSDTVVATGDPAITLSRIDGSLPPGLGVTEAGIVTGTPAAGGTYTVTVRATNAVTYDERTLDLTVEAPARTVDPYPPRFGIRPPVTMR